MQQLCQVQYKTDTYPSRLNSSRPLHKIKANHEQQKIPIFNVTQPIIYSVFPINKLRNILTLLASEARAWAGDITSDALFQIIRDSSCPMFFFPPLHEWRPIYRALNGK